MESKKTLVIGASTNPERYSFKAISMLRAHQHEVEAIGLKSGEVAGVLIHTEKHPFEDINTVTLYVNPARQVDFYAYIIGLRPKRVIFNPGTENSEFETMLSNNNIAYEEACTLVLLSTGQY